jgi:hypothetical protein
MINTTTILETLLKAVEGDLCYEDYLAAKLQLKIEIDLAIVNEKSTEVLENYLDALENIYSLCLEDDLEVETSDQFLSAKELRDCYQNLPSDWNQLMNISLN